MTWTTRPRSERKGLSVIQAGSGPEFLLIHGVGLRAEAWNRQIDALTSNYSVTAVDLPGHGESAAFAEESSLGSFAEKIGHLLEEPAIVVGHSLGAMIAMEIARQRPQQVLGIAVLNAIFQRSKDARAAVQKRACRLDGKTVADPTATLERWFGNRETAEKSACHDWLTSVDPKGYQTAYHIFAEEDGPSPDTLRRLACPALFLTGGDEPNSTPAMSKAMAELALLGKAAMVDGAAHMMPMTHPEEVTRQLLAFGERCLN